MQNVVAVIMGGGRGTRLYPLTQRRSKPAVPLAGKYRLVDIPISNCINSGVRNIFVLSQFQSASLNRHVSRTYRFDPFSPGFVEILAAEQTEESSDWYQGTADAVRKQLHRFLRPGVDHILVLSGDQLYVMDFRTILDTHLTSRADITVAATPVPAQEVCEFGILQVDAHGTVRDFVEKPRDVSRWPQLALGDDLLTAHGVSTDRKYLASMGIYVFRPDILTRILEDDSSVDFGKEIIPRAIQQHRVHAHFFADYWEDIGTIRNFFLANLDLASSAPPIQLFREHAPIFTRARFLPPSCVQRVRLEESLVCEGCRVTDAEIDHSIIGIRSVIGRGVRLSHTVMMGADGYDAAEGAGHSDVPLGIGAGSRIEHAIIDKNARIGEGVVIGRQASLDPVDGPNYFVRDGIVVVPKHAVLAPGTVI